MGTRKVWVAHTTNEEPEFLEALATWGVEVLVVDMGEKLRAQIRQAQQRQVMVNPSGPDEEMDV